MDDSARTAEQLRREVEALKARVDELEHAEAEARRTARTLKEVEDRFRGLFDNSVDGVALHEMVFDDDGTPVDYVFLAINPAFTRLTTLTEEHVLGKRVTEALPGVEHDPFIQIYGKVASTGEPVQFQQYSTPLDRHYDISAYCPQKNQFAVSFRDISEWKRAEELLQKTKDTLEARVEERTAELRHTNRELTRSNTELERFVHIASHDLQEPLRTLSSFLQLLARRYEGQLDERADTYIRYAVEGADHMRALVNGLLEYSRVGTRVRAAGPVSCDEVIDVARRNLGSLAEETGATLTADPLPEVVADRTQLIQLLQNLLTNALRFRGEAPPEVHVSARREGAMWRLSVRDNGIGVEEPYLERIFGVFQRLHTRDEYPGTGIGLSICRRIAERHGGRIWAESTAGEGTTFHVTLPVVAGEDTDEDTDEEAVVTADPES